MYFMLYLYNSLTTTRYRPSINLEYVQKGLGFTKATECREFLKELGVSIINGKEGPEVDTKNSQGCLDAVV